MLKNRIEEAMRVLVGQPLWDAVRVLNMEMFSFGKRQTKLNRKGEQVEIGEYSLHVQCPWRIAGPEGIVVGSQDRCYPEEESSDGDKFDPEQETTRCESNVLSWLKEHATLPLLVESFEADELGGFRLFLKGGFILEAFPSHSLRGEYSEHWRLLINDSHFVVTGHSIE